jgi:hypothetical protein
MERLESVNYVYHAPFGDLRIYRKLNLHRRYLRKMTEPLSGHGDGQEPNGPGPGRGHKGYPGLDVTGGQLVGMTPIC